MLEAAAPVVHPSQEMLTHRTRILIVEDEPAITRVVTDVLEADGYEVVSAATGAEATELLEKARPDLVILDLLLPDSDGLVLCSEISARWPGPIIILSATKQQRDRILSLKLGADDFIAKPFDIHELVARVEAVLRRAASPSAAAVPASPGLWTGASPPTAPSARELYRIGAMVVDAGERSVTIGGAPIQLTPTENRLLTTLASQPGHVFSREELAQVLWGTSNVGQSRAVDVHIRRLRAKLEPFGMTAPPIVTARGFGYRLARDRSPRPT